MERSKIEAMISDALAIENDHKRSWACAKAVVGLDEVQELEEARAFVLTHSLGERFDRTEQFQHEIELRQEWIPSLDSVDSSLSTFPQVALRAKGIAHKVALLAFARYCSCDVEFACALVSQ